MAKLLPVICAHKGVLELWSASWFAPSSLVLVSPDSGWDEIMDGRFKNDTVGRFRTLAEPEQGQADEVPASTHGLEPRWQPTAGEVRHRESALRSPPPTLRGAPSPSSSKSSHSRSASPSWSSTSGSLPCKCGVAQAPSGEPHKQRKHFRKLRRPAAGDCPRFGAQMPPLRNASLRRPWATFS